MNKLQTNLIRFFFWFSFFFKKVLGFYYFTDRLQYLLLFAMQNKTTADDALFEFKDFPMFLCAALIPFFNVISLTLFG